MRKTILYIAMSLDGYIAEKNGGVDWLSGHNPEEHSQNSYEAFTEEIDTVIMGWNTYYQVVTELSPKKWVYKDFETYVITHREKPSDKRIFFVQQSPAELISELKKKDGKDIWICGGANIVWQLMKEQCIDRFHLSIIPIILGGGIRLFDSLPEKFPLRLLETRTENGIVELIYEKGQV